jgi:hypothetical protein
VGSGQWAVGSGQWAVGSGQWAVGSGQWAVVRSDLNLLLKPHVEQRVGLVEHQRTQRARVHVPRVEHRQHAARRTDDHVHPRLSKAKPARVSS